MSTPAYSLYGKGDALCLIEAVKVEEHYCDLRIWRIGGWEMDGAPCFGDEFIGLDMLWAGDGTPNLPPWAEARIRWDACSHWEIASECERESGAYWHICGPEDAADIAGVLASAFHEARRLFRGIRPEPNNAVMEEMFDKTELPAGWRRLP